MTAKKLKVSPSNSWQNRSRLVVFGDSLADIGNAVDPLTGQSLRQSDGLVLVEALLEDFGIAADSSIPAFFGTPPTGFKSPLNYAFVGATTGEDGSEAVGLGGVPIGLLAQVERFQAANSGRNANKDRKGQDAVIAAGANDLFEFFDKVVKGTADPTIPPPSPLSSRPSPVRRSRPPERWMICSMMSSSCPARRSAPPRCCSGSRLCSRGSALWRIPSPEQCSRA